MFWGGMFSWAANSYPLVNYQEGDHVDWVVHGVVYLIGIVLVVATGSWEGTTFLYDDEDDGYPNILQRLCWMCVVP